MFKCLIIHEELFIQLLNTAISSRNDIFISLKSLSKDIILTSNKHVSAPSVAAVLCLVFLYIL